MSPHDKGSWRDVIVLLREVATLAGWLAGVPVFHSLQDQQRQTNQLQLVIRKESVSDARLDTATDAEGRRIEGP